MPEDNCSQFLEISERTAQELLAATSRETRQQLLEAYLQQILPMLALLNRQVEIAAVLETSKQIIQFSEDDDRWPKRLSSQQQSLLQYQAKKWLEDDQSQVDEPTEVTKFQTFEMICPTVSATSPCTKFATLLSRTATLPEAADATAASRVQWFRESTAELFQANPVRLREAASSIFGTVSLQAAAETVFRGIDAVHSTLQTLPNCNVYTSEWRSFLRDLMKRCVAETRSQLVSTFLEKVPFESFAELLIQLSLVSVEKCFPKNFDAFLAENILSHPDEAVRQDSREQLQRRHAQRQETRAPIRSRL